MYLKKIFWQQQPIKEAILGNAVQLLQCHNKDICEFTKFTNVQISKLSHCSIKLRSRKKFKAKEMTVIVISPEDALFGNFSAHTLSWQSSNWCSLNGQTILNCALALSLTNGQPCSKIFWHNQGGSKILPTFAATVAWGRKMKEILNTCKMAKANS